MEMEDSSSQSDPVAVVERVVGAVNHHDLDALVGCFHEDYVNETPAHPGRGFQGNAQVRRNWTQILASVPDLQAGVLRRTVDGDDVWTEWQMAGTRRDGEAFLMRGVVIFAVRRGRVASARFYLEPVEEYTGDVDAAVRRLTGGDARERSS